ncbi:hypothetical protein H312_03282 [Anncaliia algerae PRA339]|uniref:Uncharacterized protein n=1 Tax=Anncaliia algerae PRA339 TaxID=1288291 RepID=A0A059EWT3_9MICR|nr:hypothetical protein H312_03282 [Anncaliia algerae PRA339]
MNKEIENCYEELSNLKLKESSKTVRKSELFGKNTFNIKTMEKYVKEETLKNYIDFIKGKGKIGNDILKDLANGMLNWAMDNGATHYTHWFQPLTGSIAEKHDTFLDINPINSEAIEKFSWKNLLKQEPDASSFPHGCIRSTYEARGYTTWDPSTNVFLFGSTMCIPAAFFSHNGYSLDYKIPLIKAEKSLQKYAAEVFKLLDSSISEVNTMLGWEQEFFLLKKSLTNKRIDLDLTNRTLLGISSAKGQKMNDHYFGSMKKKALRFIKIVEDECRLVGIPIKTRHNEVAPNQFELAHIYEKVNLAVDHNSLLMDIMHKVAYKLNLKVIFHEKPFLGVNGSGKHCNFSFITNTGENLTEMGKDIESKIKFFTFLTIFLKAINDNEEIIRSSVATTGNEHRLGACEAPTAIISVYLGDKITSILEKMESCNSFKEICSQELVNGVLNIFEDMPQLLKEHCDRNRTSPIAFVGNKFEFRSVGSEQSCAKPMIALITAVANEFKQFKIDLDKLVQKNSNLSLHDAFYKICRDYFLKSKRIIFNGDNYSQEWSDEAIKRGLSNKRLTAESLKDIVSDKSINLFTSLNVFTKEELFSRYNIELETYTKKVEIEGKILSEIILNYVIPDSIKYQNILLNNYEKLKSNDFDYDLLIYQPETIKRINYNVTQLFTMIKNLKVYLNKMNEENLEERAKIASSLVNDHFKNIRNFADELESIVGEDYWSLIKYTEFFKDL